jgi:tol-pal system protein YbgF
MAVVEQKLDNQALLEMSRQLDALSAEVRTLRGELEKLQHELDAARRQQRDQYLDLDTRLRTAEASLATAQATTPAAGADAEYQAAFKLLKESRYDEAAAAFTAFLKQYPDHELASNAQYWLGEVHYVKRDFPAALTAFEGVLTGFPAARKLPDALLKAGYCHYELGHYDLARTALARVTQDFPETTTAVEAAERLKRMTAEGR